MIQEGLQAPLTPNNATKGLHGGESDGQPGVRACLQKRASLIMIAENNKEKKYANMGGVIWGQMLLHAIR